MAEDIGLVPERPRRMWTYANHTFHIIRTSEDSALMGLWCPSHIHATYIIGLTEDESSLLVGRREAESPKYEVSSFQEALEQGAQLMLHGCPLTKQLDDFFAEVA